MDKETVREQLRDYAEMTERAIDSYLPETECLQKNVILSARSEEHTSELQSR